MSIKLYSWETPSWLWPIYSTLHQ